MKSALKYLIFILLLSFHGSGLYSQKPKDGKYTYKISFEEYHGKSLGATCIVIIKGDSITIINNGSITGDKGEIIDEGIILKHQKTGTWIIAHSQQDRFAKDIGGCKEGPSVVDFKKKIFYTC